MISHPTSQEEAAKLTYGQFSGKRRYDPKCCVYRVWSGGRGSMDSQCSRKPGHGPAALYCKQHAEVVAPTKPPKPRKLSYVDQLFEANKELKERVRELEAAIREHKLDYTANCDYAPGPRQNALWAALE